MSFACRVLGGLQAEYAIHGTDVQRGTDTGGRTGVDFLLCLVKDASSPREQVQHDAQALHNL